MKWNTLQNGSADSPKGKFVSVCLKAKWNADSVQWSLRPREPNLLQKKKKTLQIKKTLIWQHMHCKCSQHNQIKKRAANNVWGNRKVMNMAGTYLSMFTLKGDILVYFPVHTIPCSSFYIISLNKLLKYTITVTVKGYVSWLTYTTSITKINHSL